MSLPKPGEPLYEQLVDAFYACIARVSVDKPLDRIASELEAAEVMQRVLFQFAEDHPSVLEESLEDLQSPWWMEALEIAVSRFDPASGAALTEKLRAVDLDEEKALYLRAIQKDHPPDPAEDLAIRAEILSLLRTELQRSESEMTKNEGMLFGLRLIETLAPRFPNVVARQEELSDWIRDAGRVLQEESFRSAAPNSSAN